MPHVAEGKVSDLIQLLVIKVIINNTNANKIKRMHWDLFVNTNCFNY